MEDKAVESFQHETTHKRGCNGKLGLAIFAAVLGMFQFGYNITVINAPESVIKEFYNSSHVSRYDRPMSDNTLTIIWALTVAITAAGGCIGGLLGAPWSEKFGRKKGMLYNTVFGLIGAGLMAGSKFANSYEMLIVGRFVIGFNCGLTTVLTPMFNAEVAPPNTRGAIGTVNQQALTIGLLIAQVLGLSAILGTETYWPLLLGLAGVAPILQLLTLPFCPESPRYLLITCDEKDAAITALQELRGTYDVSAEIQEMVHEREQAQRIMSVKVNMCQLCSVAKLRLPLTVAIIMHLSQQLSGINCILYYSVNLFTNIGLSENDAQYASLAIGGIMVVMALVSIPLMDYAGRRSLHLTGLAGAVIFSIAFTICYHFAIKPDTESDAFRIASIVCALIFVVFFAIGPGPIPLMIVPEFFSQGPRPTAVSIGVLTNWLANFAVGLAFPPLQEALKDLILVPFTCLTAIFFVFLFMYLPETKGKTFEEISALFSKTSGVREKNEYQTYGHLGYNNEATDM